MNIGILLAALMGESSAFKQKRPTRNKIKRTRTPVDELRIVQAQAKRERKNALQRDHVTRGGYHNYNQ